MRSSTASRESFIDRALVPGTALIGATFLIIAAWMAIDPRSFYDSIGNFGPYNSHYIGDAAAFQAGIGIALIASIWTPALRAGALLAATAMTGLHAVNHWVDVNDANGGSNADVFDAVSLAVQFVLTLGLLRAALRRPVA
jgi:predicted anti-sigma-YlaC factor YlaD